MRTAYISKLEMNFHKDMLVVYFVRWYHDNSDLCINQFVQYEKLK